MLPVTDDLILDDADLEETFVRASGPGGQNVNKVSTAVQLRFRLREATCLSPEVKARLMDLAGAHVTASGDLLITAQRFRHRERNRLDARERLARLVRRALIEPIDRVPTGPSRASVEKRLREKRKRSERKRDRGPVKTDE